MYFVGTKSVYVLLCPLPDSVLNRICCLGNVILLSGNEKLLRGNELLFRGNAILL